MRIAFISFHTSPADRPGTGDVGGMNVVEMHLAHALADVGHEVDLITRRADPKTPELTTLRPGVRLLTVAGGPPTPLAKSAQDAHLDEFRDNLAALVARRIATGERPYDVVHSHHWMSGVAALPLARNWDVPHVQSFHSVAALPGDPLHEGEPPESPARVGGEAECARRSDLIVTISAHEAGTVVERCGADPDRVSIVSPGVDHQLFRPLLDGEDPLSWTIGRAEGRIDARGYVLFAARLQPLKGADLAIDTLARLSDDERPHLVVAGADSDDFDGYASSLADRVTQLGLTDDVTFLGPDDREVLAAQMRGARALLVPSHSETFGLVALEAASSGTPVLAMAAGGLREAVVDGESGLLMWDRDPTAWAAALRRLLAPRVRLRAGQVGRIHARRFRWEWAAARLVDHYHGLITGTSTRSVPTQEDVLR